jgi:nickel transport protein
MLNINYNFAVVLTSAWRHGLVPALVLILVLGLAGNALAHKVNVFAYAEAGRIKGEAYFAGGDKAQESLVELLDAQGKVLASTKTDAKGEFSLALSPQAQAPLKVVLKAGLGHQGDYTLGAGELSGHGDAQPPVVHPQAAEAGTPAAPVAVSADLEQRLGHLLDQRLQPLTAQIAKLNADRGVTVHDVVAGLGYILGLLGLAAYMKTRR